MDAFIIPVIVPLALGLILGSMALAGHRLTLLQALGFGAAIVASHALIENSFAIPPVSSKEKLALALVAAAILGAVLTPTGARLRWPLLGAGLLGTLYWLGARKLARDPLDPDLYVALAAVLVITALAARVPMRRETNTAWLAVLVPTSIAGALVAAFGAYVSAGQFMGALAALGGGAILVVFVAALAGRGAEIASGAVWALAAAQTATLTTVALFAPSYSLPAILLAALTPAAILLAPRLSAAPPARVILTCGLTAALPAAAAGALAALAASAP
ncbi:MAG: hypothetical protein AAFQ06_10005 [Pseudomonadota bacterium]